MELTHAADTGATMRVCTDVVDRNRSAVIAATSDAMPNDEANKAVLDAMVRVWELV